MSEHVNACSYDGYDGKLYNLLSHSKNSAFNQPSDFLVLISYLKEHKDKSYRGFLHLNRKTIVSSSDFLTDWKDLDDSWSYRFLTEAQKLDESNFLNLENKVRFFILQREGNSY